MQDGKCRCGYEAKENAPVGNTRYCGYNSNRLGRCTLLGTMSDSQRTESGTQFFCGYHSDLSNHQMCEDNLARILSGELKQHRGYLHDLLDITLQKLKSSNPEIFYKPRTEAERDEYVSMIMGYMRRKPILKTLPYNKHKNLENSDNIELS
jgi:hypothetical protein